MSIVDVHGTVEQSLELGREVVHAAAPERDLVKTTVDLFCLLEQGALLTQ